MLPFLARFFFFYLQHFSGQLIHQRTSLDSLQTSPFFFVLTDRLKPGDVSMFKRSDVTILFIFRVITCKSSTPRKKKQNKKNTNCPSQPLYNSVAAESKPLQSTPKSQPLCGGSHVYSNHGWVGMRTNTRPKQRREKKREHPLHLSVFTGLKAAEPQTLNICGVL